MPEHDDILLPILTDRLRLLIQIHDNERPGMRVTLCNIERALTAYQAAPEATALAVAA